MADSYRRTLDNVGHGICRGGGIKCCVDPCSRSERVIAARIVRKIEKRRWIKLIDEETSEKDSEE